MFTINTIRPLNSVAQMAARRRTRSIYSPKVIANIFEIKAKEI
jgi:hypothetical protein